MQARTFLSLIPMALLLASASAQAADKIAVAEPSVVGVDEATGSAFVDLLRDELRRKEGVSDVVAGSATPDEPCGEAPCAQTIAEQTGADKVVVVGISRLGDKIVVRYALVSPAGEVVFSDRTTAYTESDLERIAPRAATGLAGRVPWADTVMVSKVTYEEAQLPVRQRAMFTHGLGVGSIIPFNSYGGASYIADVRLYTMYELRNFAAGVEADILWTPDGAGATAGGLALNLSGKYFPDAERDLSPFFEGGVGIRFLGASRPDPAGTQSDGATGLGAFAGGGIVLFRSADLHVVASARYDVNFIQFDGLDEGRQAHGLSLNLGIAYTSMNSLCPFF